jgi:hypothetical protein
MVKETDHESSDPAVDTSMILKLILCGTGLRVRNWFSWLSILNGRILWRLGDRSYVTQGIGGSIFSYLLNEGCHLPQTVSHRLLTAAARIRTQVRSYGICGGQSGSEVRFLRVLRFPLPILIPPIAPHPLSSINRGWYNRPNSGRRAKWTQSHDALSIIII